MRVLLVNPTFRYKDTYPQFLSMSDFPSGFGYLSAVLKQMGHEVFGLNPNNRMGHPSAKLMLQDVLTSKIKEIQPELIGFGGLCTDYAFLKDAIAITRSVTDAPVVLGGQIVTNDCDTVVDLLRPDFAVSGEAEIGIQKVIELMKSPNQAIVQSVPVMDLDSLPFPDYEPFGVKEMLDKHSMDTRLLYRYSRPYPRPFIIVASRSCPFTCTFCVHGRRDAPYRARSLDNIMAEIKVMYEKYEFNILIILDELFAVKNARLKDFSQAVLEGREKYKWDFDWMFQTHASAKLDLESLKLAKEAGCFFFSYGLESASPTVLKSMNKRIDVEQVVEAMDLAKQAKVGFGANLIFGDPAETEETWAESLAFWLKHGRGTMTFLATLMPYPGSTVFETCRAKGMFQDMKKYYETIDDSAVNMTAIPNSRMKELMNLTNYLERQWLFVKDATKVRLEKESGSLHKIWATCPYCGEESLYRNDVTKFSWFGVGCTKCHQRISIPLT